MALTNSQYDIIIRGFEEKQRRNRRLLEERTAYVHSHVEGYRELSDSIASASTAQGRKLLAGDEHALDELRGMIRELSSMKRQLILGAGLSGDYLDPVYECSDCKDTGFLAEGGKCHCFKQAVIDLLYEQSGIRKMLESENFNSLSSDYHNLFFYGTVGTGKSFLSGCVAKELLESGHSVIYFSASELFDLLSRYKFDYKSFHELHAEHEDLFGCDLLIIDDLGTEYTNNLVNSELFSLINERHLQQKATVISTNLSLEDFRNRYSDRIFSRITSNYEICKLTGPDIRMYKKRMENRK